MMIVVVSLAVALVAFILYALERKSNDQPIVWTDAIKLSLFGGLVSAGVVFTTTADTVASAVTTVVSEAPAVASAAQEMFVGSPSF